MESNTLQNIALVAQLCTPFLILCLSGVGTFLGLMIKRGMEKAQRQEQRLQELEAKLRDERIEVYNTIIDPLAIMFSKDENLTKQSRFNRFRGKNVSKEEIAASVMLSYEYKLAGFKLALFGSDEVVRAYGRLMQHSFKHAHRENDDESTRKLLELMGDFLIEIRRSVGNEETNLDIIEMFEWFITDIENLRTALD